MERLVIVRHGETDFNVQERWQGHIDIPLNANGLAQAQRVAARLKNDTFEAIFTSDLKRAHATAEAINQHHKLPLQLDQRLREVYLGHFEGLTSHEIHTRFPEEYAAWSGNHEQPAPGGGESDMDFLQRIQGFLDSTLPHHPAESALLVTHGGTIRFLMCAILDLPLARFAHFRVDNTAISEFQWYHNRWNLVRFNDIYHLNGHVTG
jgi:alpha-ribazole phosphatase